MENRQVPSDANGVYSLPSGYEAVTGETIQASQHNPPLEDLESAMSQRLMRSGVAPMTGALKVADGAVGSPAVQFNTSTSTGFYKTTDGIGVAVNGTKVAEFKSSGLGRVLGEIIPWSLLSAPSGWVLVYGQTLSRTTYADLWTIAQTEIAGGNTFFNNGNGTTTFGIGDLRGRVIAGKDNMGGSAAGRLTAVTFTSPTTLGASGGTEAVTLTAAQLPPITPTFTGTLVTIESQSTSATFVSAGNIVGINVSVGSAAQAMGGAGLGFVNSTASYRPSGTIGSFGSGDAHSNMQPTMICNYILYVGV